jgi:putative PIN family toxin of toxin-antitoxin system
MRAVFDTNVYLAAAKKGSYAQVQLQRARPSGPYELFISPEIIIETRRKLEQKFGFTTIASAAFIDMVMAYARLIQPRQRVQGILRDTDDHIILECALEAKAHIIVTADRELLRLKAFESTTIIHPTMLQYIS